MKKLLLILLSIGALQACTNSNTPPDHVPASENDGIKVLDSNGGLADSAYGPNTAATDTSKMEDRVDLSKRDTFDKNPHR